MLELRPADELFPRLNISKDKKILAVDGPNIVQGHVDADFRSSIELHQIDEGAYETILAWFTENDHRRVKDIVTEATRILAPGGSVWVIVPKKNSLENHKATGVTSDIVLPLAKDSGLTEKKTLGIGPHYYSIRLMKHGEE